MDTILTTALSAPVTEKAEEISADRFDEIMRQHQRRVYRVIFLLVRDRDTADTLTQECFLRAYRSRAAFRGDSSVGTWLVRIAINLATDHGRNRRSAFWRRLFARQRPGEVEVFDQVSKLPDPAASPLRQLVAREELRAVWSAVDSLSSQQRTAFILRFVEELSIEEIAGSMRIEIGTVKSHLARALASVRKQVKENGSHA